MGTNGVDIAAEARLDDRILGLPKAEHNQALGATDKLPTRHTLDETPREGGPSRSSLDAQAAEMMEDFALAPLVDKIAHGIATGLILAMKDLERHIAMETRKVGDAVGRRLDTFQVSLEEQLRQLAAADTALRQTDERQAAELDTLRTEAREFSATISQRVDAATASLQEADGKQASELEALRSETKLSASAITQRIAATDASLRDSEARQAAEFARVRNETNALSTSVSERIDGVCRELGVHQEDIEALKTTLGTFSSRMDSLVERLDRQADAVRSMCTAYSQRETELEQLVDGLARLRAYPTRMAANGL
jgi:chromosome segregation ATPase